MLSVRVPELQGSHEGACVCASLAECFSLEAVEQSAKASSRRVLVAAVIATIVVVGGGAAALSHKSLLESKVAFEFKVGQQKYHIL